MKKRIIFIALIIFAIFSFFNTVYATLNIETEVEVPVGCTVTDTDGVAHSYPQTDSPSSYLAICALDTAIKNGFVSDAQFSNQFPSMGLFITAINNVVADPNSQYWAIYQNENMANSGIVSLPVIVGDTITFKLNDFSDTNLGDQIILHISSLTTPVVTPEPEPPSVVIVNGGSGGLLASMASSATPSIPTVKPKFDIEKAFEFLISQQKENGSFGEDIYTDWVSIAFSSSDNFQDQKIKLKTYLERLEINDYQLTDYERHTIALMSLGLNPYNTNNENYIKKIIEGFDGQQFGDIEKDNDDIFALIALQNAGYTKEDNEIKNAITFILSKQKENGSWDDNVDMTGAGITAIVSFQNNNEQITKALVKAEDYLKQNQKDDGGFGNTSSTAWAMEGILALSGKPENWIKNNNSPLDYLATQQDSDGSIKNEYPQNKIWETAYAVSSLSQKNWNQIMQKFEKQKEISAQKNTIEEKPQKTAKTHVKKTAPKIKITEKEQPSLQNVTASAINALNETEPKQIKNNWFKRFLTKIFSIF
jgi:hypothetical protein